MLHLSPAYGQQIGKTARKEWEGEEKGRGGWGRGEEKGRDEASLTTYSLVSLKL